MKYAEFVSEGKVIQLWDQHLRQQIYLGDDDFIARIQKQVGLDAQDATRPGVRRKANVNKIQSSAPGLDSDIRRYSEIAHKSKAE